MKDLKFIIQYSKPYSYKVFSILVDVILYVSGLLMAPLILSYMIDNVINGIPLEDGLAKDFINMLGEI